MRPSLLRWLGGFFLAFCATALVLGTLSAGAAQPTIGLGTAGSFGVLAGAELTNTGPSVINGNIGVSPGTAITGFPPGIVNGTVHSADAAAAQAQADTTTAYNDAAGRSPATAVATELGGQTLLEGIYANDTLGITGELTLDGAGDPEAVFIFQADSTLITASDSVVTLIGGAQACNVFWQVGSSATLGTSTRFVGTVLALTSITANNGATVEGRLLARNAAVTLINNTVTVSNCAIQPPTTTTTTPATSTTSGPTTTSPNATTTTAPTATTTTTPATTTTTAPTTTTTTPATTTTTAPTTTTTTPATTTTSAPTSTTTALTTTTTSTPSSTTTVPALTSTSGPTTSSTAPTTSTSSTPSSTTTVPAMSTSSVPNTTSTTPTLPSTGSDLTALAIGGAVALLLGAAMVHRSGRAR